MFNISKSVLEKIQNLISQSVSTPVLQTQGLALYAFSSCSGGCRVGCYGCDGCKGK